MGPFMIPELAFSFAVTKHQFLVFSLKVLQAFGEDVYLRFVYLVIGR